MSCFTLKLYELENFFAFSSVAFLKELLKKATTVTVNTLNAIFWFFLEKSWNITVLSPCHAGHLVAVFLKKSKFEGATRREKATKYYSTISCHAGPLIRRAGTTGRRAGTTRRRAGTTGRRAGTDTTQTSRDDRTSSQDMYCMYCMDCTNFFTLLYVLLLLLRSHKIS